MKNRSNTAAFTAFGFAAAFVVSLANVEGWSLRRSLVLIAGSGYIAVVCLFASLSISVLARLLPRGVQLGPLRRALGLCAAIAACGHVGLVLYERGWRLGVELLLEPQLRMGLAAFVPVVSLAATSFPQLVERTGLRLWKPLHRVVYAASAFVILHITHSAFAPRWVVIVLAVGWASLMVLRVRRPRSRSRRGGSASRT